MTPILPGNRVVLRAIEHGDAKDLFEIYGDEQTMEFASDPAFPTVETVYQMMDSVIRLEQSSESFEWAVMHKTSEKVIGTCGLHSFSLDRLSCEVGCMLNASYWRQGYMTEALQLLIGYAQTIGLKTLRADIDTPNFRSRALFDSLGFVQKNGVYQLSLE